ncbi:hypothetical protein D5F01_LYC22364 [Xyrichtys novacula]|uniref:Uncharacterized protein n=1 Tax=Xyrichtys novacula TaxID=13765 RepID=A0AAV1EMV8_XYRNO|nr:hypothetical protein D5F01_LYC22364 [Xyrichtys novacula]
MATPWTLSVQPAWKHPPSCHDLHISDHLLIKTVITLPDPPTRLKRTINFRNLKSISPSALTAALSLNLTTSPPQASDNPSDLVTYYNQTLSSCLNLLAPVKSKSVTFARSAPWYTPALHQLKQKKRQLERLYRKTGLTIHLQLYRDHLHQYKATLNSARSAYYSNIIHSGSSNPRTLFSTINSLLAPHDNSTSTFTPDKCQTFLQFFQSKIDNIYNSLQSATSAPTPHPKSPPCAPPTPLLSPYPSFPPSLMPNSPS